MTDGERAPGGGETVRGGQSMTKVVAENVRRLRKQHGWTQNDLRDKLKEAGPRSMKKMSPPTMVALEAGRRSIEVSELFALGLVLGVAPHLLLYPPPGSNVRLDGGADEAPGRAYPGRTVADWLWDPDEHPWSTAGVSEWVTWFESAGMKDQMTPEDLQELSRKVRRRQESQALEGE